MNYYGNRKEEEQSHHFNPVVLEILMCYINAHLCLKNTVAAKGENSQSVNTIDLFSIIMYLIFLMVDKAPPVDIVFIIFFKKY